MAEKYKPPWFRFSQTADEKRREQIQQSNRAKPQENCQSHGSLGQADDDFGLGEACVASSLFGDGDEEDFF